MMMMVQHAHNDDDDATHSLIHQPTSTSAAYLPLRSRVLHVTDIAQPAVASIYPLHVEVHIGRAPRASRRQQLSPVDIMHPLVIVLGSSEGCADGSEGQTHLGQDLFAARGCHHGAAHDSRAAVAVVDD